MESFIDELAASLYDRYGDEVSSLTLLFPSRRAQLFFSDALSRIVNRPIWQPHFVTIDELMVQVAGIQQADPIKLLTELYKVYSRYHDESFDAFYYWGEMLLNDFDQVDKYLIDADVLFANITDLHALDNPLDYLTTEQVALIERFWGHFSQGVGSSPEKERFLTIWSTLPKIYHEFRDSLMRQGLAYGGMVQRLAAEKLSAQEQVIELDTSRRYVVVGLNALTSCERKLFLRMQKSNCTEFYWDYDRYYVDNPDHEAGLFLRANLRDFPSGGDIPKSLQAADHFAQPKEMVAISSPSDALQCKYVHTFLQGLIDRGIQPGKQTAIVLTDETLLLPVLYSIPASIGAVNVTMGYPLRQTTAYSFVERLIELQSRKRLRGGVLYYYHSDLIGLMGHPYILACEPVMAHEIEMGVRRAQTPYVRRDRMEVSGLLAHILAPIEQWAALSAYLREVLALVTAGSGEVVEPTGVSGDLFSQENPLTQSTEELARRREFFSLMIDRILQLEVSLQDSRLEISMGVFAALLRKILQQVRIPYQGEPLQGIQVMGILETRNLDFENILLLSVNDDTFPGNRATATSSFIPHNLRLGYGLPTPLHHEGVYGYYFYRLIQRAKVVHMAYCSRSDEKRTGEPSRYIYQLLYESPHTLIQQNIPLSVHLAPVEPISIPKQGDTLRKLERYQEVGGAQLSPTSFHHFLECPLKFYFKRIAQIQPEEQISEQIDHLLFGTLLHKAMELLYRPLLGLPAPSERIKELVGSAAVAEAVKAALQSEYFKEGASPTDDWGGNVLLVQDVVSRYMNTCVLPHDASHLGFVLQALEQRVDCRFEWTGVNPSGDSSVKGVNLGGIADRIDLLESGLLRVVDYKTGKKPGPFEGIEALFSPLHKKRSPAAFQTLLYALMLYQSSAQDVEPALYYVREMNKPDFSPLLVNQTEPIRSFLDQRAEFEHYLSQALERLFDPSLSFTQCEDIETCGYCDFRTLCRR